MKEAVKWCVINGAMAYIIYLGLFMGMVWAQNITLFMVWLYLFVSVIVISSDEEWGKYHHRGRAVPRIIGGSFDLCVVFALVAAGWFATAVAYGVSSLLQDYIYEHPPVSSDIAGR